MMLKGIVAMPMVFMRNSVMMFLLKKIVSESWTLAQRIWAMLRLFIAMKWNQVLGGRIRL